MELVLREGARQIDRGALRRFILNVQFQPASPNVVLLFGARTGLH